MKKLFACLCAFSVFAALLTGCSFGQQETLSSAPSEAALSSGAAAETGNAPSSESASAPADIRIMALKGPTAMGLVQFMDEAEAGRLTDNRYQFTIAASADEVTPKLVQGEADIAAVPANLASVLYNNTQGAVEVLAVNTLGVIYIVENGETVGSVEDLRGKTIYASGKGSTPEYALNYILSQNGMDPAADLTIEWKSEHTECLSALMANENSIAMLPQPFVTTAQSKSSGIRVALDLTEEWDKLQADAEKPSALITGVVVARREFVEQNPQAVSAFLDHYKASVEFVNANLEQAAELVGKYGIVPAEVAQKALPACNITFIEGAQMQEKLSGYLSVLLEQNPKSVGGALPGEDFYYSRSNG